MFSLKQIGFTLIELMVTIVILGVLVAIAVPTYTSYVRKSHRIDAKTAILVAAIDMEQYYSRNNTYIGATLAGIGSSSTVSEGTYAIALSGLAATAFVVTAKAIGVQTADTDCASLSINQAGTKSALNSAGVNSSGECW